MFLYDEYFIVFFIVNRLPHILFSTWATALIENDGNISFIAIVCVLRMLSGCRLNVPTYLFFKNLYLVYIMLLSIKAPLLT